MQFHNSLTGRKEVFSPREPGRVQIYVCGVTVYDRCHIGHGRAYVVWDTLRRYLEWRGFGVQYVQNFTDIDDKIIQRANQEARPWQAVVEDNIQSYYADMALLNIKPATLYPRAMESVPEIKDFISALVDKGYAYAAAGDVYYAVRKFDSYGKLSGKKIADLEVGASERIVQEDLARKRDPLDFALWKGAKPGEPAWDSTFGSGRPGWHIECSAMIAQHMGETIDIHAGGEDLVFPHHENEIAQSEALHGHPLANLWMHNAFVQLNGEKMSKSLGNFITIHEIATKYHPLALRLLSLQSHYRTAINFTDESLAAAARSWKDIEQVIQFGYTQNFGASGEYVTAYVERFTEAMDNDLATPQGLAIIFELVKQLLPERNRLVHGGALMLDLATLAMLWRTLIYLLEPLGLVGTPAFALEPGQAFTENRIAPQEIAALISERRAAKQNKDYATADQIRQTLMGQGVVLVDSRDQTTSWHWQD